MATEVVRQAERALSPGLSSTRGNGQKIGLVRKAGFDWYALYIGLSGEVARFCEGYSVEGYPLRGFYKYRHLGRNVMDSETGRRRFDFLFPPDRYTVGYNRDAERLLVITRREELIPPRDLLALTERVLADLSGLGIDGTFPARVARVDVTGDLVFGDAIFGRSVILALQQMRLRDGRGVAMRRPWSGAILTEQKGTMLGGFYDKGRERREVTENGVVPDWRWIRLEARCQYQYADDVKPETLTTEWAREKFLDRFGGVPMAAVPSTAVAQLAAKSLLERGVSKAVVLRLVGFLALEDSGMAESVLSRDAYLSLRAECRKFGLADSTGALVKRDDVPDELDVRAMVEELSLAL